MNCERFVVAGQKPNSCLQLTPAIPSLIFQCHMRIVIILRAISKLSYSFRHRGGRHTRGAPGPGWPPVNTLRNPIGIRKYTGLRLKDYNVSCCVKELKSESSCVELSNGGGVCVSIRGIMQEPQCYGLISIKDYTVGLYKVYSIDNTLVLVVIMRNIKLFPLLLRHTVVARGASTSVLGVLCPHWLVVIVIIIMARERAGEKCI